MKKFILLLFLLSLSNTLTQAAQEDFMGRVSAPTGVEVEVIRFKTDQIVFAGTNGSGLFISYDAGTNWMKLTGFPVDYPCIKDIIFLSNKDLCVATFGGGIFISHDNGAKWIPKNNGLKNLYVQALIETKDGQLVCGTYTGGIYFSNDKGESWVRTDKGLRYDNVTCLATNYNNYILAGTRGGGIYVSRDSCKSWIKSNTELPSFYINGFTKDESGKVYAATESAGVVFTGDGITWTTYGYKYHYSGSHTIFTIANPVASSVAVNKYQMVMGTRSEGLYYWDDIMNCWQNSGDFALGITACATSPNGTILAIRTTNEATRSTDNGETWSICSKKVVDLDPNDYSASDDYLTTFTSDYDNSLLIISKKGSERRIYKSYNNGNNWNRLGTFTSGKINDAKISPDGNIMVAATEGVFASLDGGTTFNRVLNVPDKKKKYQEFYNVDYDPVAKIWAATWTYLVPDTITQPPKIPKPYLEFDNRVYKSTDDGSTWTNTDYHKSGIDDLYVDIQSNWFMSQGDNIVKSTDHGSSFQVECAKPAGKIIYGKDNKIYYFDDKNNIYQIPNKLISFRPNDLYTANSWRIEHLDCDAYGNLYLAIQVSTKSQGLIHSLYVKKADGNFWEELKGCYNMNRIRSLCTDNIGYAYVVTNALYKILNPKALQIPKMKEPKNEDIGVELNPVIAWEKVPFAEEYELQVDQLDDFNEPFEVNVTGDSSYKLGISLFHGQDFYWRIRSKTHSAYCSEWSELNKFKIGEEPPILISPANESAGISLNAELVWKPFFEAVHYQIQVAEDENFEKIVFEQDNCINTTITTNRLPGLITYYWRVKAYAGKNASIWSSIWKFRTVLGPPKLVYPENNSIDCSESEQFKWRKASDALSYCIQIAKDTTFNDAFYEGSVVNDTVNIIGNMLPETDYFWRVASINDDGKSEYSETWKFTTMLKPVALRTPLDKKVNVPNDVLFGWMEHNSGSQYQIQISKDSTFKTTVDDQKVNNLLEFKSTKLEYYKTYYWRVRLLVGERVGLWSDIWSFKTGIESANLLNPPDKSVEQPTTLKFKWYEVLGAKYYQLQISKNEQFTDLVYSIDSLTKPEQYVEDLEPEILYYWHVRAWNEESYGTSQWSNVWTFTTGKVTLILRNPKTGSMDIGIPSLLTWFSVTTADFYHLQVAQDANFANIIFDQDSIDDTRFTLSKSEIDVNKTYYWHVKGVGKQYTTPWSETWQFATGDVSVQESELFSSIKLYPNPTGSKAELSINYAETCDAKILISTAEGKILKTDAIRLILGETRYEIDAEHMTSGTYYITIITPTGFITRELVVFK